jgi:hypothetical protein
MEASPTQTIVNMRLTCVPARENVRCIALVIFAAGMISVGGVEVKIGSARAALAVIFLSTALLVATGFSDAGATVRTSDSSSKFCQEFRLYNSKNFSTPQESLKSLKKIAEIAPVGIKKELLTFVSEMQSLVSSGSSMTIKGFKLTTQPTRSKLRHMCAAK